MSDVQDFIREKGAKPSRSALHPYKGEILELRRLGFSYKTITEFLSDKKGIKTSLQNVGIFIRSVEGIKTADTDVAAPTQKSSAPSPKQPPAKITASKKNSDSAVNQSKIDRHPINTGFKKFNSREQLDIDDLI